MRLIRLSVDGLELFSNKIEIDFFAEQNVMSNNTEMVHNPFGKIYTNNVMSIVGVNASGKTSLLKLIAFSLDFLRGELINNIETRDVLLQCDCATFEIIFYDDKDSLYKLTSKIAMDEYNEIDERYIVVEEELYKKKISKIRSKKDLFTDIDSHFFMRRDTDDKFLKDDMSIAFSISRDNGLILRNLIKINNRNMLKFSKKFGFPKELVHFLDSNIDYINYNDESKEIELAFKDKPIIYINKQSQLFDYMSSGTIKGITVFLSAMFVFYNGGYLIVDELENHFNREIVRTLLRFFMNDKINKSGATLIFSTHYSELLDEIERSDNIYIVQNKKGIVVQKLSNILNRNDIKKSDVFKSGYIDGTTPYYETYIQFKNAMINGMHVEEKMNE